MPDATPTQPADVLETARKRFRRAEERWRENRTAWREDLAFANGDQWDADQLAKRRADHRPAFVFNRVAAAVDQIVGEARMNRPSVRVGAVHVEDGKGRLIDDTEFEVAKILEGLIRQIEDASSADQAYDTALESAACAGFGAFRLVNQWSKADPFVQELRYRRIKNALTVLPDPDIQEADGSDMGYCFVTELIPRDEFERRWPGKSASPVEFELSGTDRTDWFSGEDVRVAEYYRKVPRKRTFYKLSDGRVTEGEPDEMAAIVDELAMQGITVIDTKEVDSHAVMWSLISGVEELEPARELNVSIVPVFLVFGKEAIVDGRSEYRGVVRYAKDPQKAYNYSRTTEIERVALAPKAPILMTPEEVEGHEDEWKASAAKPFPYLLHNNDPERPGQRPQRIEPASTDIGATQLSLAMVDDIKATTGKYDASLGAQGNETSGKAIFARKQQSSIADFSYVDNLNRVVKLSYRVAAEWIQKIYDTQRVIRIRNADETEALVRLMQTVVDEQSGRPVKLNDLTLGTYNVTIQTGPSYATQRLEAADTLMKLANSVPMIGQVAPDLLVQNLDVPLAHELAQRLKRAIPPTLLDDNAPPPPPTPADLVDKAKADADLAGAQADMQQAIAKTAEAELKMKELEAQIAALPAQIEQMALMAIQEALTKTPEELFGVGMNGGQG